MPKRRKILITILIILLLSVIGLIYVSKYDFNCQADKFGPQYCTIDNTKPSLLQYAAAVTPEIIQVKLGSIIAPFQANLISPEDADEAFNVASPIYQEMDQTWRNLPSALGYTYEKILKVNKTPNHYFVYIPQHLRKPAPILLFLHGLGGNFKSYTYLLSKIADEKGFAIIAPSYKSGTWDQQSVDFIKQVVVNASQKFNLDSSNMTLIGLSNGGLIIPQVLKSSGFQFSKVVFISTFVDPKELTGHAKYMFIYGKKDKSIGIVSENLSQIGFTVKSYENEDHFLFFHKRDEVLNEIKNFLN